MVQAEGRANCKGSEARICLRELTVKKSPLWPEESRHGEVRGGPDRGRRHNLCVALEATVHPSASTWNVRVSTPPED